METVLFLSPKRSALTHVLKSLFMIQKSSRCSPNNSDMRDTHVYSQKFVWPEWIFKGRVAGGFLRTRLKETASKYCLLGFRLLKPHIFRNNLCTLVWLPNLSCAHLDRVAGLGGDALHGQDDLEGVLPDVPGTHTAIITSDKYNNSKTRFAIDSQRELSHAADTGCSKKLPFVSKHFKKHYSSVQQPTCTEATSRLSCGWPRLARTSGRSPKIRQSLLRSP